jgi:hypothetical protein
MSAQQIVGREPRWPVSQDDLLVHSWRYRATASTPPFDAIDLPKYHDGFLIQTCYDCGVSLRWRRPANLPCRNICAPSSTLKLAKSGFIGLGGDGQ